MSKSPPGGFEEHVFSQIELGRIFQEKKNRY